MGFFSTKQDVVLSSPLEGILTYQGKPAAGVKIERRLEWYDGGGKMTDFVVTKSNGHFSLPLVKQVLKISKLVKFVVFQEIYALHQDEEVIIWTVGKDSKIEYGELGGKPINLHCEITDEKRMVRDVNSPTVTRCIWEGLESWVDTEYPD